MTRPTLPTLFISHGSPMTALEPREAGAFMKRLGPAIDAAFGRPKAIVAISAHTLAREPLLLAGERQHAVYDFGGFDPRLNQMRYDAPGAPALADRVKALLEDAGIPVHLSPESGLDHGIWTPLRYIYPEADVPVLPLAFPPDWSPQRLFALGRALAPLADERVLVVGSGSLTHNLRMAFAGGLRPTGELPEVPASAAFRRWVADHAAAADWPALLDYRAQAPHAVLMHPTDEHWLPWYPAAGAAGDAPRGERLHESVTMGCIGMDLYAFGPAAAALSEQLRSA